MSCVPILFIGPIVTLWVGHDTVIYLCLLGVFVASLLLGARRVIARWNTWYLNIPRVTDGDVVNWYISSRPDINVEEVSTSSTPRKALFEAVQKERRRRFWSKRTTDEFVRRMADGYDATIFLLVWYCRYSRTKMPLPYSPTWNLQLKAAVDTLGDMQKGLRMHSAFLHWRHTGADVWCGIHWRITCRSIHSQLLRVSFICWLWPGLLPCWRSDPRCSLSAPLDSRNAAHSRPREEPIYTP
jgi:hypothetical protein